MSGCATQTLPSTRPILVDAKLNIIIMNKQKSTFLRFAQRGKSAQRGVVLLEALVAILLFSMGVLAVAGLQGTMIKNTSDSKSRSEASYIAQQKIGQMWADPDPAQLPSYLISGQGALGYDISNMLPNGTRTVTRPACAAPLDPLDCPFVITITWQQPGQTQHTFTTTASISGG
jgi:type IV pilus assembly protein PilV